jgi:adenine deaminase
MPRFVNKSARIYHLDSGMLGPGQTIDVSDEEVEKPGFQGVLATGEVVEERDLRKLEAAEQKAQQTQQKAGEEVQKAEEGVRKAHEQTAQKHQR